MTRPRHVPTRQAMRVDSRTAHAQNVETLRSKLPLKKYLFLLDQAVTTGYMPRLDPMGQPVPPDAAVDLLTAKERADLAGKLINLSLPALTAKELDVALPPPPPPVTPDDAAQVVHTLTMSQLEQIANPHLVETTQCDAHGDEIPPDDQLSPYHPSREQELEA